MSSHYELLNGRLNRPTSTAFPNVALSKPPIAGPTRMASSSVAKPRSAANGMIAMKEKTKTSVEVRWAKCYTRETRKERVSKGSVSQ